MADTALPSSPADAVMLAVVRAQQLGWRTITVRRLARIAGGDYTALPPAPAPKNAQGSGPKRPICYCDREIEPGEDHSLCYPGMANE
jgi:hypothetical protein